MSLEVKLVGLYMSRSCTSKIVDGADAKSHSQGTSDRRGDLFLQFEDMLQLSIVGFGPDDESIRRSSKLGCDSKIAAFSADASLEN